MKKDKLEEYIIANRSAFTKVEKPDIEMLWKDIDKEKSGNKDLNKLLYVIIGLLIVAIALLGIMFVKYANQDPIQHYVRQSPQLLEEQENLLRFVKEKEDAVYTQGIKKEDYAEIFKELEELELMEKTLILDFDNYAQREKIVKTLFRKYERKSKILEQLLSEIEKNKNYEKKYGDQIY